RRPSTENSRPTPTTMTPVPLRMEERGKSSPCMGNPGFKFQEAATAPRCASTRRWRWRSSAWQGTDIVAASERMRHAERDAVAIALLPLAIQVRVQAGALRQLVDVAGAELVLVAVVVPAVAGAQHVAAEFMRAGHQPGAFPRRIHRP